MKRTLLSLLLITGFIIASAQNNSYKIFDRKRGTAYQPSLVGADEKYIYVFTSGISESGQHHSSDAVLSTYRISDLTPVKTKQTDFNYKGKDLSDAAVHILGNYVILTYRHGRGKAPGVTWIALNRETLEPVKEGELDVSKLNSLSFINVHVSPDGKAMIILYGDHEKELITCFDKDMNTEWKSDFSIPDNDRIISDHIDNNQNIYLVVKELPSADSKKQRDLQIMTLSNKAASKDIKAVTMLHDKSMFNFDVAVSGEGSVFIGGIYSNGSGVTPDGVFTIKLDPTGSVVSDSREMPNLNKKSTKWHTGAGVTDKGEFYFYSSNSSRLEVNSYSSSGAPAGGYSSDLLDGYAAVFANTAGKIDHAINWHHFPIPVPDVPVSIAPIIENGKPYLFTDYSKQQLDKWGKTDYSKEIPSAKERIKSPTRQICSVTNFDEPSATMPAQLFTMDKGYFGCSNAKYVPSLHMMVFFGCVTEGKYGQGYTNFCIGKGILQ